MVFHGLVPAQKGECGQQQEDNVGGKENGAADAVVGNGARARGRSRGGSLNGSRQTLHRRWRGAVGRERLGSCDEGCRSSGGLVRASGRVLYTASMLAGGDCRWRLVGVEE